MPVGQIISQGIGEPNSILTFLTMGLGSIPETQPSELPQNSAALRAPFRALTGMNRPVWQTRPAWQARPAWRNR